MLSLQKKLRCFSEHFSFFATAILNNSVDFYVIWLQYLQTDTKAVFNGNISFLGGILEPKLLSLCWALFYWDGWLSWQNHIMLQNWEPQGGSLCCHKVVRLLVQLELCCWHRTWAPGVCWDGATRSWDGGCRDPHDCPGLLRHPVQQPSSLLAPWTPEAFTAWTYLCIPPPPWECLVTQQSLRRKYLRGISVPLVFQSFSTRRQLLERKGTNFLETTPSTHRLLPVE